MNAVHLPDEEVLARYDRYLQEFVEALNVCPFARRAREGGRLQRAVCNIETGDVDAGVKALMDLTAAPVEALDVAVLIFPRLPLDWTGFNRYTAKVREIFTRTSNPPGGFFIVSMHPDSPMDLSNTDRAVSFMRRTPHPSMQVARAKVILDSRRTVNPEDENVSERVARLGLRAVQEFGPERAAELLANIRAGRP